MSKRCSLCGKTTKELVQQELTERWNVDGGIDIHLSDTLAFPYDLCSTCEDFLRVVIPAVLAAEKKAH